MIKKSNAILIGVFFLFVSCAKEDGKCFATIGDAVEKRIEIDDFTQLEIHDKINYTIKADSVAHIVINYSKNLIDGISIKQTDNQIIISNNNICHWLRDLSYTPSVTIYGSNIETIEDNSYAQVDIEKGALNNIFTYNQRDAGSTCNISFDGQEMYAKLNTGIGNIVLTGAANFLYTYNASSGFINAENLISKDGYVINRGSNFTKVNVEESLSIENYFIGNVLYKHGLKNLIILEEGTGKIEAY